MWKLVFAFAVALLLVVVGLVGAHHSSVAGTPTATPEIVDDPTPTPGPTIYPPPVRGDINCDHNVDFRDAIALLRWVSAWNSTILPEGCLNLWDGTPPRGDLNCDGEMNAADALVSLRFAAGLPFPLPSGCPPLNS